MLPFFNKLQFHSETNRRLRGEKKLEFELKWVIFPEREKLAETSRFSKPLWPSQLTIPNSKFIGKFLWEVPVGTHCTLLWGTCTIAKLTPNKLIQSFDQLVSPLITWRSSTLSKASLWVLFSNLEQTLTHGRFQHILRDFAHSWTKLVKFISAELFS